MIPTTAVPGPGLCGAQTSATRTYAITVSPVNDVPAVVASVAIAVEDGSVASVQIDGVDAETTDANLPYGTQVPAKGRCGGGRSC